MVKLSLVALAALTPGATLAFSPFAGVCSNLVSKGSICVTPGKALFAEVENDAAAEAAFVPLEEAPADDDTFDKVESFGKGAAKVCRNPEGQDLLYTSILFSP